VKGGWGLLREEQLEKPENCWKGRGGSSAAEAGSAGGRGISVEGLGEKGHSAEVLGAAVAAGSERQGQGGMAGRQGKWEQR